MAGVTPNAKNHANLGPKDSRFVEVDRLPWEQSRFPGVETKTLFIDKQTGSVTRSCGPSTAALTNRTRS